jgi:hypothetical protein
MEKEEMSIYSEEMEDMACIMVKRGFVLSKMIISHWDNLPKAMKQEVRNLIIKEKGDIDE